MNKDQKIKSLERQMAHLQKNYKKATKEKEQAERAGMELNRVIDSLLIQLATKYGEAETEDGKAIGYRFEIPAAKIELLDKYRVKTERYKAEDEREMLRIGVILIEDLT